MDANVQAGLKGLALARRLGVPVVVMEPVKGGPLTMLPEDIRRRLAAVPERTPAAWALDWVAEQPGVSVILRHVTLWRSWKKTWLPSRIVGPLLRKRPRPWPTRPRSLTSGFTMAAPAANTVCPATWESTSPNAFHLERLWKIRQCGTDEGQLFFTGWTPGSARTACGPPRESLCPSRIPISRDLKRLSRLGPYAPSERPRAKSMGLTRSCPMCYDSNVFRF